MFKTALMALLALGFSFPASAETSTEQELINAQKRVIELQEQLANTRAKLVKSYKASGICFHSERRCLDRRNFVNLLASASVSIDSNCRLRRVDDRTSPCHGEMWTLETEIRILK